MHRWITAIAAVFVLAGCSEVKEEIGEAQIESACTDYCDQARDCDDEIDETLCQSDCVDAIEDCTDSDREDAINDLRDCAALDCEADGFPSCTVAEELECAFEP